MSINIIDNFFPNPDAIRTLALQQEYHTPLPTQGWKGYRTNELERSFIHELIEKQFPLYEGKVPYEAECYFHYCTEDTVLDLHKDIFYYSAGIVYLHPNPPEHTGTKILEQEVENRYNRMVYYDANHEHGVIKAFGQSVYDARLTLTFFVPYPPYWKLK